MKKVSITNMKGGTGKSTLTVLFAVALASELKKKVAILDTDIQATIYQLSKLDNDNLVDVFYTPIHTISNEFKRLGKENYDYVFIDFARFTDSDIETIKILSLCDVVIVPVLGGVIEILSVEKFIKLLKGIKANYHILLNKHKRIKDDFDTIEVLSEKNNILKNNVSDLKLFRDVYLNKSILDTKEGEKRFREVYNEFKGLL